MPKSLPLSGALVAAAIICVVVAALYWTGSLQLFASHGGVHRTHAILFAGLALVCLVGANFARPRPV